MLTDAYLSEHKKFALCLKLISVGYAIGCRGGLKIVTSYLKGFQNTVTKCDDGGVEGG